MIYNDIVASSRKVAFTEFGGINRRVRGNSGEFSDMENFCHEEYPCLQSVKGARDMELNLPDGAEAVKMIIPKRLNEPVTGFSGIVKNSGGGYSIYINGVPKRSDIKEFTDAVDYNGSIIVFPELKGFNYAMVNGVANLEVETLDPNLYLQFSGDDNYDYLTITGPSENYNYPWMQENVIDKFPVGTHIILSGLTGEFENNNTWFPESSTDYSNTKSPVDIYISGYNAGGSNNWPVITATVSLKNSKGRTNIGWPSGVNMSDKVRGTVTKMYPKADAACVAFNRIWLCSYTGEEIIASALGMPFEYYLQQGIASDSWNNITGTPGKFTGITPWENRVIAFKPDIIHVIYGDTSFNIAKSYSTGCIDGGSIAEVGGSLMWLYYDGFYIYSGSRPRRVSDKLNTRYISCKAFSDGRRYYARCVKEDGTGEFFIYDSELNLWSKISDIEVVSGDYYGGKVYLSDKTRLYVLGEGEYGDFYAETPELTFDNFMDKSVMYITVRCRIQNGFLNIYTSVNNGDWIPHKGIDKTGKHKLPIRYNPGDILRLRLEGSGNVCITEMEIEVVTKDN